MRFDLKFLTIVVLCIAVAWPLSSITSRSAERVQAHDMQVQQLQSDLQKTLKKLKAKERQAELKAKQNRELKKKLQAKREAKTKLAVTTPPVAQAAPAGGCNKYRDILDNYDWNVSTALAVCNAESSGVATNDNAGDRHPSTGPLVCWGSWGLFQIGCDSTGGKSKGQLFNPATNIAHAYSMYQSSGWSPWGYTTCRYKVVCS